MKKFTTFRVRLVLLHFIRYMPLNMYSWLLFSFLESWRRNFTQCRISAIYQPAENLLHVGNIFKDTVDFRECLSDKNLWTGYSEYP